MSKAELLKHIEALESKVTIKESALIEIVSLFENYGGVRDFGMAVKMMGIAKRALKK